MKIYYFSRGKFSKSYSLDSGKKFGDNRKDLGRNGCSEILDILKKELDFKRKSLFYVINNGSMKEEMFGCLESLFKGSEISLEKISFSDLE